MSTVLKSNASDAEINAAVAKLAGWQFDSPDDSMWKNKHGIIHSRFHGETPDYLHNANAVIELLSQQKGVDIGMIYPDGIWIVHVIVSRYDETGLFKDVRGEAATFCRAAIFALLRANGVTVEEPTATSGDREGT